MMTLSIWASRNKWTSRFILVISYLILMGMAVLLSDIFSDNGTSLPWLVFPCSILVYFLAAAIYPSRKDKRYKKYYFRKTCDFLLVSCSLLMIVCTGTFSNRNGASTISVVSAATTTPTGEISKKKNKLTRKAQIKKLKALYKELKAAYKNGPKGTKAALIILSSIVAAGLLLLVLALSCGIACSGQGGAAVLVGLLGTGLVIFLLVRVIRGIRRKYNPQIREEEKAEGKNP